MLNLRLALLLAALVVAGITDVKYYKVFNWLTMPAALLGVVLGAAGGPALFLRSVEGFAAGLAAGLLFMVFARSGAGDAKLLVVVGSIGGPAFVMWSALYGAVAGLPLALFLMWRRGAFTYTLHNFTFNAAQRAMGLKDVPMDANSKAGRMPYAVAIAAGCMLTLWLRGWM